MEKQRLKYFIEFSELVDNIDDLEPEELSRVAREIKYHLYRYLTYGGFQLDGEIQLDFDLEDINEESEED